MSDSKLDYAAMLAALEAKRAQIDAAIAAIRELAGMEPSLNLTLMPAHAAAGAAQQGAAYEGMSVVKAAEAYLRSAGKWQTAPEIARALQRGGHGSKAKKFTPTVYARMHRAYKTGNVFAKRGAKWGLREWAEKAG